MLDAVRPGGAEVERLGVRSQDLGHGGESRVDFGVTERTMAAWTPSETMITKNCPFRSARSIVRSTAPRTSERARRRPGPKRGPRPTGSGPVGTTTMGRPPRRPPCPPWLGSRRRRPCRVRRRRWRRRPSRSATSSIRSNFRCRRGDLNSDRTRATQSYQSPRTRPVSSFGHGPSVPRRSVAPLPGGCNQRVTRDASGVSVRAVPGRVRSSIGKH